MLDQRCILPLKVATALTLAIVSALWLGWERPYWAGFAVIVMAATETFGHSMKKGRHRLLGTLLGVIAAFLLVGLFAQQLVLFTLFYSAFAAACVYLQDNPRNGYLWTISLVVGTLVIVMGKLQPELTFAVAVLRVQETILGIFCFTLVFSLLWPRSSRHTVLSTLRQYFDSQSQHIEAAITELDENGRFTQPLHLGDSLKQLTQLEDLIYAAQADSYHIASDRQQWQTLLDRLNQWALLCGHLAEHTEALSTPLDSSLTPQIRDLLKRITVRIASCQQLLQDPLPAKLQYNNPDPQPINLPSGRLDLDDHLEQGSTMLLATQLSQIDQLHHDILRSLVEVNRFELESISALEQPPRLRPTPSDPHRTADRARRNKWGFRPDSAIHAIKICLIIWVCIALWIYVPMPGGAMVVLLGAILGAIVIPLPFVSIWALLILIFVWSLFVLIQYVFIMPTFTEVWQLVAFYFINIFCIWRIFHQPQHAIHRLLGSQILILMTSGAMQLTPVYDIQLALLQLMLVSIVMLVIFFVNQGIFPSSPEATLLRQLSSLCNGLQQRLTSLSKPCLLNTLATTGQDPLRAITGADLAMQKIHWPHFPEQDPSRVAALIDHGYNTCLHLRAFEDSYRLWSTSSSNPAICRLINHAIEALANVMEGTAVSEQLTDHEQKLNALMFELYRDLKYLEQDSVLRLSLSQADIDASYRLLASLQLLIGSLQSLANEVHANQLHQLRLRPFTL
ncbi:FUSC family protein [Photobacterium lutimaris]|uniref:FUSC family protein n=1 Tax=Photobacterium lutimaris TaxID=388278 RepID=A0A2T3J2Z1_9GAMM|nr:FUSC family protein [Photobacterium lutimaris]PSU35623.1 hypothetical protein C9I99_00965 [Photobacterium lutimaris]TDR78676.1 putative membrane protein YccC [Photobacterium lutimaris]